MALGGFKSEIGHLKKQVLIENEMNKKVWESINFNVGSKIKERLMTIRINTEKQSFMKQTMFE